MDKYKKKSGRSKMQPPEIEKLIADARQAGIDLKILQFIDVDHCDCIWYGGPMAEAVRGHLLLTVSAIGDIRAYLSGDDNHQLCYVKDRDNRGIFFQEMRGYLANVKELYRAMDSGRLKLDDNNWFEWSVYDSQAKEYIGPSLLDNIFDFVDILTCLSAEELQSVFEYAVSWQSEEGV